MIEEKYEILDKKFNELFARTANLIRLDAKNKRSKKDLERSVKFLRAEHQGIASQPGHRRSDHGRLGTPNEEGRAAPCHQYR